jgi:hypothetical protein
MGVNMTRAELESIINAYKTIQEQCKQLIEFYERQLENLTTNS